MFRYSAKCRPYVMRRHYAGLDVDDSLPLPLAPLVLLPPVPEPVCEMQTPALLTMAQASPQPQSVDSAFHARVKALPSPQRPPRCQGNSLCISRTKQAHQRKWDSQVRYKNSCIKVYSRCHCHRKCSLASKPP